LLSWKKKKRGEGGRGNLIMLHLSRGHTEEKKRGKKGKKRGKRARRC